MVDRGGLRYTIRIDDQFAQPLDAFTRGIRRARAELVALRTTTRRLSSASSEVARSTRQVTAAVRDQNVQLSKGVASFNARRAAIKAVNAETRKSAVAQARAEVATKRQFINERRLLTTLQIRQKAEAEIARVINRRAVAEEKARLAQARGIQLGRQQIAQKRELTFLERQQIASTQRLERAQALQSSSRVAELNAQAIAQERINRVQQQARVAQILAARGLDPTGRGVVAPEQENRTFRQRIRNMKAFGLASRTSGRQANRAAFTFRRLFGILAAFAAARFVLQAFRNLVRETIRFNAAIEQSELGVAALITATSEVRDAFGGAVDATQRLTLAQGLARKQVQLLRIDALKTVATFEQLLTTFQVALAPGAQAGLRLDEIRKFTFDISNAAAAIGLAQNQLAEEIRSLLAGTISLRTTRIAASLGITNEDINNAKEAGRLFEFLQEKFAAFSVAAEKVQFTFNALFTNLIGGFQEVLLSGAVEFFDEVKRALTELRDILVTRDPITDAITPNPRAIAVITAFTRGLAQALRVAIAIGRSLKFETLLSAAIGVGNAIIVIGQLIAGLVTGFLRGANDLFNIFRLIGSVITKFTGIKLIDDTGLAEAAALLTRILVVVVGIQLIIGIIGSILGVLAIAWGVILGIVALINVALVAMSVIIAIIEAELVVPLLIAVAVLVAIIAIVAALVGVVIGVKKIFSEITGIELKWITFLKLVRVGLPGAFKVAAAKVRLLWIVLTRGLVALFVTVVGGAIDKALSAVEGVLSLLGLVSDTAAEFAEKIATARKELNAIKAGNLANLAADILEANEAAALAADELVNNLTEVLVNAENDPTLGEAAKNLGRSIVGNIQDQFEALAAALLKELDVPAPEGFEFDFSVPLAEARSLNDVLDDLPAIIKTSRKELEAQAALMKRLKEDLLLANEALAAGQAVLGLEGPVARQRQRQFDTEQQFRKDNLELTKQQAAALAVQTNIQAKIAANESRIRSQGEKALAVAERAGVIALKRLAAIRQQALASADVAAAQRAIQVAEAQGGDEAVRAAVDQLKAAEATLDLTTARVEQERAAADALFEGVDLTADQQAAILQAIEARLTLSGQQLVAEETLLDIADDQARLAGRLNEILTKRLTLLAQEAEVAANLEAIELRAEQRQLAATTAAPELFIAERRILLADAAVDAVKVEIAALEARNKIENDNLDILIARQRALLDIAAQRALDLEGTQAGVEATRERDALEASITAHEAEKTAFLERNTLELENQDLLLAEAALRQERALAAASEPFTFGILTGLREVILEAPDLFQRTVDLMKNTVQSFGNFISGIISDSFDPTKDVNLRQRFAQFLSQIASQIISMLVQVAIVKALLGLGFLGGSEGGNIGSIGSFFGAAKGGRAGSLKRERSGTYGFQHAHAVGLASGGEVAASSEMSASSTRRAAIALAKRFRPAGLHPSDTVPVWAAPDEWIIQAKSVRMYGDDVMGAINAGLVDPAALRAVANIASQAKGVTRRRSGGFAHGGQISAASASPPVILDSGGGGTTVTPIVADDDLMQQLINGGDNALREWMKANKDEFDGESNARQNA